jgi:hypothetical protein
MTKSHVFLHGQPGKKLGKDPGGIRVLRTSISAGRGRFLEFWNSWAVEDGTDAEGARLDGIGELRTITYLYLYLCLPTKLVKGLIPGLCAQRTAEDDLFVVASGRGN